MVRRFRPSKDVMYEYVGGEIVLLELATGVYYSLDGVGGRIWNLLVAGRTDEEIATSLIQEYEVSGEQAAADVNRILSDLERHRLVVIDSA